MKFEHELLHKALERVDDVDWYQMVLSFHKKFGCHIQTKPKFPHEKVMSLRWKLIGEEYSELIKATREENIVETADAIADLIYVLIGMAIALGIDLRPVMKEVQRSNMEKENGGKDKDGKVMKPKYWNPPDIKKAIIERW